jgi:hypothetical protein
LTGQHGLEGSTHRFFDCPFDARLLDVCTRPWSTIFAATRIEAVHHRVEATFVADADEVGGLETASAQGAGQIVLGFDSLDQGGLGVEVDRHRLSGDPKSGDQVQQHRSNRRGQTEQYQHVAHRRAVAGPGHRRRVTRATASTPVDQA